MPVDLRQALSEAIDRLTRAREVPRIEARAVHRFERRRLALSRRSKQQMMALLRLASRSAGGKRPRGHGPEVVWSWLRHLGLDGGEGGLIPALTSCLVRLPVDSAAAAPPGSVVVFAGTAAVKGFGQRYYSDGELGDVSSDVLGVYAPR